MPSARASVPLTSLCPYVDCWKICKSEDFMNARTHSSRVIIYHPRHTYSRWESRGLQAAIWRITTTGDILIFRCWHIWMLRVPKESNPACNFPFINWPQWLRCKWLTSDFTISLIVQLGLSGVMMDSSSGNNKKSN